MKKSGTDDTWCGKCICIALSFALAAFGNTATVAAAEHGHWPRATYYTVIARAGDTVGTIADRYRLAPSVVIKLNDLKTPGRIPAGRVMLIPATTRATREAVLSDAMDRSAPDYATRPDSPVVVRTAVAAARVARSGAPVHPRPVIGSRADTGQQKSPGFAWPLAGPVISSFGPGALGTRNEGINIAAERGAPFRAAADGTVSYAGTLRGYGNLILITHGRTYVTAYAHAENVVVAVGEFVEKGRVIGTAGTTGGVDRPQLHFEIRRGVTPVDPRLLLAANS